MEHYSKDLEEFVIEDRLISNSQIEKPIVKRMGKR